MRSQTRGRPAAKLWSGDSQTPSPPTNNQPPPSPPLPPRRKQQQQQQQTAAWFLHHHYWFLDISVSGVTLRTLCSVLGGGLAVALVLGGAMHATGPGAAGRAALVRGGLVAQAVALAWVEQALTTETGLAQAGRPAYPPALVVATSAGGLLIARRLAAAPWMTGVTQYLLICIYASKLSLLVLPKARRPHGFACFCVCVRVGLGGAATWGELEEGKLR